MPFALTITGSPFANAPDAVAVMLGAALIVTKLRLPEPSVLSNWSALPSAEGRVNVKLDPTVAGACNATY